MHTIEQVLDIDAMRMEIADLGEQGRRARPWDDQDNATRVTGRLSALRASWTASPALHGRVDDLGGPAVEMAQEEGGRDARRGRGRAWAG